MIYYSRFVLILSLSLLLLSSCSSLPDDVNLPHVYSLPPSQNTALSEIVDDLLQSQPSEASSGFFPLNISMDALAWRLALIDNAEHSIDAQYYIWHGDASGGLLLDRVIKAADRGVRVRLLIDDMTAKNDKGITVLDKHPNIDLRIFNPSQRRRSKIGRGLEMVFNLGRLNHRMHNKLIVADNLLGIVGGRNIGDEYFGLSQEKLNFRDFDLLTLGPVVPDISNSFDLYWNSDLVFPLSVIRSISTDADDVSQLKLILTEQLQESEVLRSRGWLEPKLWTEYFALLKDSLFWGKAKVIYDLPDLENEEESLTNMAQQLGELSRQTKHEILLESAYFVPRKQGTHNLQQMSERGIQIRILTNSLASTDVVAVHSGYSPYRKALLRSGIELYEYRPDAEDRAQQVDPSSEAPRIGLHTKSVIYDRKTVYVGSLNLDPRAIRLNTEIGVLVESPELAETIIRMFEQDLLPENSWRLELDKEGMIVWHSGTGKTRREPAYRFWDRISNFFFHLLPIEGQL